MDNLKIKGVYEISQDSYAEDLFPLNQDENFAISYGLVLLELDLRKKLQDKEITAEQYDKLAKTITNIRYKIKRGIERRNEKNG